MTTDGKQAMSSVHKAQVAKYGTPISEELYNELRGYAENHKNCVTTSKMMKECGVIR